MVDAAKNDLNWEFTALSYPTVIVFPKNRWASLHTMIPGNLGTEKHLGRGGGMAEKRRKKGRVDKNWEKGRYQEMNL